MKHIGIRIKELRRKKDMTQEKLAEYLNVSFQAVSKWETGASSPDLSMIVPLARLLGVSTDELFGLVHDKDERQEELCRLWEDTFRTGDTEKRYEISKIAVEEYPGNFDYLMWLAGAESSYAIHNCKANSQEQRNHFEASVKYYKMIIEDCSDTDTKNDAIYVMVTNLSYLDRRAEALVYAEQHPNADELMMWCLRGEEREQCRQRLIKQYMHKLFFWLDEGRHDLASLQAAERIIKTIVPDGNYLYLNDDLMHNSIWQAGWYAREERFEEAIDALKTAYQYAIAFDTVKKQVKEQAIYFTSPILNKLKFDSETLSTSGTSTMAEDFVEYLSWGWFDTMREREDFKALYNL